MYVYDDVGVIMDFLMSHSTHTVACLTEPVGSTKAISLDPLSEGPECTLFSGAISFTGMF